jgi:hypothetical protein
MLLQLQRNQVISSQSSGNVDSDANDVIRELYSSNLMQRIFAWGKVNRTLMNYTKEPLTELDKRLLKGFYVANTQELEGNDDEDFNQKVSN